MEAAGPESAGSLTIALVCPYSLSRPGGVQGQVVGLARALGRRGHRVTVFAPLDAVADTPEGIRVVATGRSVALPANGSLAPVTVSVRAVVRALRTLRTGGFDLIHVHEPFAPGVPYGLLVARHLPPVVGTFHRSGRSPFYEVLKPLTSRLAHRLALRCAVSPAARATAEGALGGTYEIGFNGVEVDRYSGVEPWPCAGPTVLFLGRHEERKGLRVLLSAFELLQRPAGGTAAGASGTTLWVAGDGPETGTLRRDHPDAPDLCWLGVLTEEEKVRRLVAADVVCAPSLGGESFGMVLVEAMAARAVVVASAIDGYEQAAGGRALLVPPHDARALAGGLEQALTGGEFTDPDRRRAWLDRGEAWADHWSMERLAEWYETRYRTVMVRPRP